MCLFVTVGGGGGERRKRMGSKNSGKLFWSGRRRMGSCFDLGERRMGSCFDLGERRTGSCFDPGEKRTGSCFYLAYVYFIWMLRLLRIEDECREILVLFFLLTLWCRVPFCGFFCPWSVMWKCLYCGRSMWHRQKAGVENTLGVGVQHVVLLVIITFQSLTPGNIKFEMWTGSWWTVLISERL